MGLRDRKSLPKDSFYDRWTELFLRGFGPVFQAGLLRSGEPPREDPELSILALTERAGLQNGDRVLDAGCGVAGPAIIIARHYPAVSVDGVTISSRQVAIARRLVQAADVSTRVRIHQTDYQQLPFRNETYDQILFLESTGYATSLGDAYREAFRVLKPGGRLYVKDVFCVSGALTKEQATQMKTFDDLWGCARSKTIDESVAGMTEVGFDVVSAASLPNVGTDRFVGSHFVFDQDGLRASELGEAFLLRDLNPPIEFGDIKAVKPGLH